MGRSSTKLEHEKLFVLARAGTFGPRLPGRHQVSRALASHSVGAPKKALRADDALPNGSIPGEVATMRSPQVYHRALPCATSVTVVNDCRFLLCMLAVAVHNYAQQPHNFSQTTVTNAAFQCTAHTVPALHALALLAKERISAFEIDICTCHHIAEGAAALAATPAQFLVEAPTQAASCMRMPPAPRQTRAAPRAHDAATGAASPSGMSRMS